jgi:hypothetical protein
LQQRRQWNCAVGHRALVRDVLRDRDRRRGGIGEQRFDAVLHRALADGDRQLGRGGQRCKADRGGGRTDEPPRQSDQWLGNAHFHSSGAASRTI